MLIRLPPLLLHLCSSIFLTALLLLLRTASSTTDASDLSVLQAFLKGIENPSLLPDWSGTDPCGSDWAHIQCSGSRVTQIQLKGVGLRGSLPSNLNQLSYLEQIALQDNSFYGPLPSLSGLSQLSSAYLGAQNFTSIPADFFHGLSSLAVLSLEDNPLEAWSLPPDLAACTSLTTLSLTNTSLTGSIPSFIGNLTLLQELRLAYNRLSGSLPSSFSSLAQLTRLELNNQAGSGSGTGSLSGPIDVVGLLPSLKTLWIQVNGFSGSIPSSLGSALSLSDCRLNDNDLVGLVPSTFSSSTSLTTFQIQNNKLMGSVPSIPSITAASSYTFSGNKFCVDTGGASCAPDVNALLAFLLGVNYPLSLVNSWEGNNPCSSSWQGISCDSQSRNVSALNLPKSQLTGTISPYLGNLTGLAKLVLSGNNLTGTIPASLADLPSLVLLDVSDNDIYGPVPAFTARVSVILSGNANINSVMPTPPPPPPPPGSGSGSGSPSGGTATSSPGSDGKSKPNSVGTIVGAILGVAALFLLAALVALFLFKRNKRQRFLRVQSPNTNTNTTVIVHHPSENGNGNGNGGGDLMKITVAPSTAANGRASHHSGPSEHVQVLEAGNLVISIQLLRNVTNNFSEENVLGKGGFGVVYKGELDDGTKIAVKRMISSVVSNKGLDEFQAEIAVLTKVRHRHLVALLGYCIEGNERLLVYEYMPQGTLSQHLFDWKALGLQPFSWDRRLSIALDMARGVEYLHGLAQQSFIHRDLKPSNVLLGDDFRAKVSDFGLVKLAPEGKSSVETRLAGTFGYLAPEYAVTGRVTTKSDVFSFGVMLMELLTGRKALDETRPEESMHLVTWFGRLIRNKEAILNALDPVIEVNEETTRSILTVAELSGHCTVREPHKRPDMSHAVNVLSPLVEHWKPNDVPDEDIGIDLGEPLSEALKRWQGIEDSSSSANLSQYLDGNTRDSIASIPPCPLELAHTFASTDGR